jgi:hypothetical protein
MAEKKISKNKIQEGIAISLDTCQRHLDSAEVLIKSNFLESAVESIEHAIEEFGRAVYLKERLDAGLESIEVSIEQKHWLKYDKAFTVLPIELKTIWENTTSPTTEPYIFTGNVFDLKGTISPYTRCNANYTTFNEKTQQWQNGILVDAKKLTKTIDSMRKYVLGFKN